MGPDGSGHHQEISALQTSHSTDKRESQAEIKWLVFNNYIHLFLMEG